MPFEDYRLWSGFGGLDGCFEHRGMQAGQLIELCGEMATGRTTIALQMVARCLVYDPEAQVIFLDCQVSLSHQRLLQMIRRFQAELLKPQEVHAVISRIRLYSIAEYAQLAALLQHLWTGETSKPRLLVIDGIGTCLRSHSLEDYQQWQLSIRQVGLALRRLACRDAYSIILSNQLNAKGDPVLGDCWSQFLDHRFLLRWRQGQRLLCFKGQEIPYDITDQGIV